MFSSTKYFQFLIKLLALCSAHVLTWVVVVAGLFESTLDSFNVLIRRGGRGDRKKRTVCVRKLNDPLWCKRSEESFDDELKVSADVSVFR